MSILAVLKSGSRTEIESHTLLTAAFDTMPSHWNAAKFFSSGERSFQIDARAFFQPAILSAERSLAQRFSGKISGKFPFINRNNRQAAPIHRDRLEPARLAALARKARTPEGRLYFALRGTANLERYMRERPEHFRQSVERYDLPRHESQYVLRVVEADDHPFLFAEQAAQHRSQPRRYLPALF